MFWPRLWLAIPLAALGACQFPDYAVDKAPKTEPSAAGAAGAPEVAPDPCAAAPCLHDGRCVPVDGAFVCLCADGFRGDTCEIEFDNCSPDPCQNGGTCVDGVNTSHCDCVDGWDGTTCQHDADDCTPNPCQNGGACVDGFKSHTCTCSPGFVGDDCSGSVLPNCQAIRTRDSTSTDGVYSVDPDGPGQGNPPLEVLCDMTHFGGGWTLVGQERQGDSGTMKFLGVSVGDASRAARNGESALIGEQFKGSYSEMRLSWTSDNQFAGAIYFKVLEEVFVNNVRQAMPVDAFFTTDSTLNGWVGSAGGAVFCRASQSPNIRPGDSSWAIKPKDDVEADCGCNSGGWYGRGAYYGGHPDATECTSSGGGWAAVADNGDAKGNVTKFGLQIWIR